MTQVNLYQLSEKKKKRRSLGDDKIFKEVKIILDLGH
jgi:hypothetical protein